MNTLTYEELLLEAILKDPSIVVMTAENRAAIRNLPNRAVDNFIDVGISEMTLVGMSSGLALRGRKPIIHALAMFLVGRAYEFIRTDIGYPNLNIKLVGYVPGLLSTANGPTHQAIDDISLMRVIPNMNIFAPSDYTDLLIGLPHILESQMPFYIRYTDFPQIVKHQTEFEIGKAELVKDGKNITILTYGLLLKQALLTAQRLEEYGLTVRVLNLRTLKPVDEAAIINATRETQLIVTIEDHLIPGGLYSIVVETMARFRANCPVLPFGFQSKFFKPAYNINDIIEYEGLSGSAIASKVIEELKSAGGQYA